MTENPRSLRWLIALAALMLVALIVALFSGDPPSPTDLPAARQYFEVRRMYFGVGVLGGLFFLLLVGIVCAVDGPTTPEIRKEVFDTLVKIVPSIMTLVLGFYFGQQHVSSVV